MASASCCVSDARRRLLLTLLSPIHIHDDRRNIGLSSASSRLGAKRRGGLYFWSGVFRRDCSHTGVCELQFVRRERSGWFCARSQLQQFSIRDVSVAAFTQILEGTGRCVAVSEPNSPTFVATKYRRYGDSSALRQLARDVIRWECRPYPTIQPPPLGYFLKLITHNTVVLPIFKYAIY